MKVLFAISVVVVAGCAHAPDPSRPVRITVLHTNDHHGHYWRSSTGEHGLAARKTLIDRIRADVAREGGHTLLLDAGDVNTGVPESDQQDAEPDFRGMSLLGYDAMAVGNHEFDKPQATQDRQRQWSSFPWLSANLYRGAQPMFTPYKVFTLGTARVAVVGLTAEEVERAVGGARYPQVRVEKPAAALRAWMPEVRRSADVVIALTHLGHYLPGQRGVNPPGDVELAHAVPGIDVIVGGHSHDTVCMDGPDKRVTVKADGTCTPDHRNGTWIVQAGDRGRYLGRADFEYAHGTLRLVGYRLLPVNLGSAGAIAEDPAVLEALRPFQQRGDAKLSAVVGHARGRFDGDRSQVRHRPAALGHLITAAMLERTGADVAVVSGGGIRNSLPEGPITYRDLLKVQPFGNRIVVIEMTGAELQAYLAAATSKTPGSGAYAQIGGVQWSQAATRNGDITLRGKPLDLARTYRLATIGFLAGGGDGYPVLPPNRQGGDAGWIDVEVLRDYIAARGTVAVEDHQP